MNTDNDRLRDYLGITVWHNKGYTGKGMIAGNAEDFEHSTKGQHPYNTNAVFKEVAPDCTALYLPAEGYQDERFMQTERTTIKEKDVCAWTCSLISYGTDFNKQMNIAFDDVKDICSMFIGIGNNDENSYAVNAIADHVYGVGAAILRVGETEAVPEGFSSTSEYVDFVGLDGWWIDDALLTGTSFASPCICGMAVLVNQLFKEKTGKCLTSDQMYQFFKDNSRDISALGKDTKTGWGIVILPDPDTIDVTKYTSAKIDNGITIKLTIGSNIMNVNGVDQTIDQPPIIDSKSGRTLIPVRAFAEAMGGTVIWDAKTKVITITKV